MNLTERDCIELSRFNDTGQDFSLIYCTINLARFLSLSHVPAYLEARKNSARNGTYVNNERRSKRFGNGENTLGKFAQDLSRFYESAFKLFGHKAGERQRLHVQAEITASLLYLGSTASCISPWIRCFFVFVLFLDQSCAAHFNYIANEARFISGRCENAN